MLPIVLFINMAYQLSIDSTHLPYLWLHWPNLFPKKIRATDSVVQVSASFRVQQLKFRYDDSRMKVAWSRWIVERLE